MTGAQREDGRPAGRNPAATGGVVGGVVGVGLDLVEIDRFAAVLERRSRLLDRVFTPAERGAPVARRGTARVAGLAGRFAAKEAVMKALGAGIGQVRFADVEITRPGGGAPSVVLHGSAAARASAIGVTGWHVSITHTQRTAAAVAVASARGDDPDAGPRASGR